MADPSATSTRDLPAGERAGRYELFAEIGAGGMARVHVGRLLGAADFARTVAVKRPLPALTRDEDFRRSASNEARLAARVHHPNVVPTLDVVEHGDELLIVMEYVRGESLAALASLARARGERVPVRVAAALVAGALRGLGAVHEARDERRRPLGLIHRDVSPQNILVGVDGLPRLSDFGLAKAAGHASLTGRDEFKGKLTYASPEQVALEPLTPATDLYSMGLVLWELVAGERLYSGLTAAEIVARLLAGGSVPRPSRAAAGVSALLDPVVERATRLRPGERFESAAAMAAALDARVEGAPIGEVAAWVCALAGPSLAARERLVMAAERQTTPSKRGASQPPPTAFAPTAPALPAGPATALPPAGAAAALRGRTSTLLSAQPGTPNSFELAVTMPVGPLVPNALARPGGALATPNLGQTLASATPPVVSATNPAARAPGLAGLGGASLGDLLEVRRGVQGDEALAMKAAKAALLGLAEAGRWPPAGSEAEQGGVVGGPFVAGAPPADGAFGASGLPASPRPSRGALAIRVSGLLVGVSLALVAAKFLLPRGANSPSAVAAGSPSTLAPPLATSAPPTATGSPRFDAPGATATGSPRFDAPGATPTAGASAEPPAARPAATPPPVARSAAALPRKKPAPDARPGGEEREPRREANCSPPYSIDAEGIRHMKPGCQ